MALPSSGSISLNQVNVELLATATRTIGMNNSEVRTLAGIGSGQIAMSNLRGKSNGWAWYGNEWLWQDNTTTNYAAGAVITGSSISGIWEYQTWVHRSVHVGKQPTSPYANIYDAYARQVRRINV